MSETKAVRRIERMNRRRGRRGQIQSRRERWARVIRECGLWAICGPWPFEPDESIRLDDLSMSKADELRWIQARAGITVDGILGPQSWLVLAQENHERHTG